MVNRSVIRKTYTPDVLPGTVGHAVLVPGALWHVSPTGDPTGAWTTASGLPPAGLLGRLVVTWPGDPVPPSVVAATVPELVAEVDRWRAGRGLPPVELPGVAGSPAAVGLATARLLRLLIERAREGAAPAEVLPPGWHDRLRAAFVAAFDGPSPERSWI